MARYTHVSDNKGRIILPAKLREGLGSVLYVTYSLDKAYLTIYTAEQFENIRQQINALPGTEELARRLRRSIIGEALRVEPDNQGRISISEELWKSIAVEPGDAVSLLDMGDSLQLCSEAFYQKQREAEIPLSELDLSAYEIRGIL